MRTASCTFGVVACLLVFGLSPVFSQQPGDQVVPKSSIDLKVKNMVVETVDQEDVLTVERVQDTWIWVSTAAGTKGWIKADAVEPYVESAPASPDDTPPEMPEEPLNPETDRLFLIGTLGSAHVYMTYAYIGVLADGLSKELYTVEQTKTLLGEVVSVSGNIVRNMARVRDGGLSEADATAINNMIEIYKLLQVEAKAAIAFAESRSVEDAQAFDAARTAVWPQISDLLGLEADPAAEGE